MTKKVSILIPLYNAEKWIAATIESILKQSYTNIEIIIVDDGSSDESYKIAKSFESDKLKVYQQKNKGASAARNTALQLSTGDYIIFFDADDLMFKDKIKNQMLLVKRFGDDFIYSSQWIAFKGKTPPSLFPEKTIIDKNFEHPTDWLKTSWENRSGAVGIWLTPRKIIDATAGWDESIVMNDDGEYFFRVLLNSKGVKFANNAYMFYRRDVSTSITKTASTEKINDILKTYIKYEKILEVENTYEIRKGLATNYINFIYTYHLQQKELINIAWQRVEKLNISENWKVGGKKFQLICKLIGFKNALKLKHFFNK